MSQPELFNLDQPVGKGIPVSRRCTPARSGTGPEGETCKTCQHLKRFKYHGRDYIKCGLMQSAWSHGAGTDIRLSWDACREHVKREEE